MPPVVDDYFKMMPRGRRVKPLTTVTNLNLSKTLSYSRQARKQWKKVIQALNKSQRRGAVHPPALAKAQGNPPGDGRWNRGNTTETQRNTENTQRSYLELALPGGTPQPFLTGLPVGNQGLILLCAALCPL